jgi:hypothetical protein
MILHSLLSLCLSPVVETAGTTSFRSGSVDAAARGDVLRVLLEELVRETN